MNKGYRPTMEAEEEDETSIPMSDKRTIYLVNVFMVHTARFLNRFSALCEQKLAQVHGRILRLDATLTLLEAKLKSVDGLEEVGVPSSLHVSPEFPSSANPVIDTGDLSSEDIQHPLETSEPLEEQNNPVTSTPTPEQHLQMLRDDPKLSRFVRMLQVGVPEQAVKRQMSIEGLDPDLLKLSSTLQSPN
uniref:WASH complex subunit 3 n=1 Tax=Araucaria cunninghamii TaxID=56994 RepID=A0A0D6R2F2_ARACU